MVVYDFVQYTVLFRAERNFPFRMTPEDGFHRMVVIAVKEKVDARKGLRFTPLQS